MDYVLSCYNTVGSVLSEVETVGCTLVLLDMVQTALRVKAMDCHPMCLLLYARQIAAVCDKHATKLI